MDVVSTGIVTPGCRDCRLLKKKMTEAFQEIGINLSFIEIDYTAEEDYAMEMSMKYDFEDIPAFEVAGVPFMKGFDAKSVRKAARELGV